MPHHRVAANGNSAERRGASWRSMLIMLFKLVVTRGDLKFGVNGRLERGGAPSVGGADGAQMGGLIPACVRFFTCPCSPPRSGHPLPNACQALAGR